eukprot:TRINITY_DN48936_c0_g1_i1.p1 TRINITY_DN48936_c0_g1~~TRINITY_DN48936_c0_g1_i1.p1  ORF type:complete len:243 (+),score=51.70 TRINITY_DN48936_c0_g1_i1:77-805(+)
MTVNLSPEAFRKSEAATSVSLGSDNFYRAQASMPASLSSGSGSRSAVRLTVESPVVFPDGATRYQVRVEANGNEWVVSRRFSDFEALEQQLAPAGIRRAPFPTKGFLGLQNKFNIGDFKEKRHAGLQAYLSSLAQGIGSLRDMPALEAFCNPEVQSVAPAAGSSRGKAAAGAAAVGAVAGLMVPIVGGVVVAAAGAGAAAYATQRTDNVGEISRKVGSIAADGIGKVVKAVKTAANDRAANR